MGVYNSLVITSQGLNLISKASAGEVTLKFTRVVISDYQYPEGTNFKELTGLNSIRQSVTPSTAKVVNDTTILVRGLFHNTEVTEEYYIYNVGVFATDGTTEILFSVTSATTPDQMPAYSGVTPSSFIYANQYTISDAASISLVIDETGTATIADLQEKVDIEGGDISNTIITTLEESAEEFPVPVTGESTKTFFGKVRKFIQDFNNFKTGILTVGMIVNNAVTDNSSLPVSAAVAMELQKQLTQLNSDLTVRFPMYKITASPDLNDLKADGIYLINATSINAPEGATQNSIVFVFNSVGTPCQFFTPDNQAYLYKRWYNNSTSEWRGWYKSSAFTAV